MDEILPPGEPVDAPAATVDAAPGSIKGAVNDAMIFDARAYDELVRTAREALATLTSQNVYLPSIVAHGRGTRLASVFLFGFTEGGENMFRNRHLWERVHFLQPFLSAQEAEHLWAMVKDDKQLHEARKQLMFVHRSLIETYRQILVHFSETTLND